jgi:hypothetical protein
MGVVKERIGIQVSVIVDTIRYNISTQGPLERHPSNPPRPGGGCCP